MTPFEQAIGFTLAWECGPATDGAPHLDPHDPGGFTRWGISQRAHPDVDVPNLTRGVALDLYRDHYWVPAGCEKMPPLIAMVHFDHAVNRGVLRAIEAMQVVVRVEADGVLGPRTLAALDLLVVRHGEPIAAAKLVIERMRLHLVAAKEVHVRGLLRRCVALQEFVLGG